MPSSKIF